MITLCVKSLQLNAIFRKQNTRVSDNTFESERPDEFVIHGESFLKVTKCNLKEGSMPSQVVLKV